MPNREPMRFAPVADSYGARKEHYFARLLWRCHWQRQRGVEFCTPPEAAASYQDEDLPECELPTPTSNQMLVLMRDIRAHNPNLKL